MLGLLTSGDAMCRVADTSVDDRALQTRNIHVSGVSLEGPVHDVKHGAFVRAVPAWYLLLVVDGETALLQPAPDGVPHRVVPGFPPSPDATGDGVGAIVWRQVPATSAVVGSGVVAAGGSCPRHALGNTQATA